MRTSGLDSVQLDPPTIKVRHRQIGIVTINAADFDPAIHTRVDAKSHDPDVRRVEARGK